MTAKEKLEVIVRALDMKRGENIQVLEISDLTILADYFVIVNGTSNTHVKTLADEAEFKLSEKAWSRSGRRATRVPPGSFWTMGTL